MNKSENIKKLESMYINLYSEKDGSERTPDPEEVEQYKMMEEEILKGDNQYEKSWRQKWNH